MSTALALVRYRRGVVGEAWRSVHLAPLPVDADRRVRVPHRLTALCRQEFEPDEVELLTVFAGMPCVECMRLASEGNDRAAIGVSE